MKILIIGSGVIGTTISWQLSEAGHDLSMFIRKEKKTRVEKNGITIDCKDFRWKKPVHDLFVYKPRAVDDFSSDDRYDLIIVPVKYSSNQSCLF